LRWPRRGLPLIAAMGLGCAQLPDIAAGVCGNAVVEPSEDCDTFVPVVGAVCRPKGTVGECHLDCRPRNDGTRSPCPQNWGCSPEGICRPPTGDFEPAVDYANSGAWTLQSGDFDGDGIDDIIGLEPPDSFGRTRVRYHYFDAQGMRSSSASFPKLISVPVIADLNRDGRSDLVFSDSRISVLLGRADRSLIPETYNSYHFDDTQLRMVPVYGDAIQNSISAAALLTQQGITGYYNVDPSSNVLRLQGQLTEPIDVLAGEPVSGNIIEDPRTSPCREVVTAYRGQSQFSLADVCASNGAAVVWRDRVLQWNVTLEPPAPIDSGAIIVDVNGDHHLDVLIGADGTTYVSYGDGQRLATAIPFQLRLTNDWRPTQGTPIAMPLAAGDVSSDGIVDFVFSDHLLVSVPNSIGAPSNYVVTYVNLSSPWTLAAIADVNGNGQPDIIAASDKGINIEFFNGNGTEYPTNHTLSTNAPVKRMVVGDVDGDLIDDVAFTEQDAVNNDKDAVQIAFGMSYEVPLAPIQVARVDAGARLVTNSEPSCDDLLIISSQIVGTRKDSDLAILFGGDRLPYAPLELTSFASNGSVAGSAAFALAVGAFAGSRQANVMAIATPDVDPQNLDWRFWLVPSLIASNELPLRLPSSLDIRLTPSHASSFGAEVSVTSATGDFDGDGLDEAVWAIPADDDTHCGLVFVGSVPSGVGVRSTAFLAESCVSTQVRAIDADADGHLDIALLTGHSGISDRSLFVLWNDGRGEFADSNSSLVSGDDSPRQFAFLPQIPQRPVGFAYVTESEAVFVGANGNSRSFTDRRVLITMSQGTGITAADIDGDGVTDLVLAASGALRVMKAHLNPP
jgi:hypothetical protein